MAMKQALIAAIVGQFGHPRGTAGSVVGWVMAHRRSNRQRNRWVASLLAVQPGDRVLEVGFGPGLAIAELSRQVGSGGRVWGIDHSRVMLQQATRRNAAAIAAGRVTLILGTVEQLPPVLDGPFDAILAVNSLGFWNAPAERLEDLRRRLAPGGRIAIASQPRCPGATRNTSLAAAGEITGLLGSAGFTKTRTELLGLDPPVVCVLAGDHTSTQAHDVVERHDRSQMLPDAAIQTSGLSKRYGSRVAVDGLDLAVPAGQVTGFVGPNGAGKTTTIRMLLGLIRPSSGDGFVLGRPLDQRQLFLQRVGALVEGPAFYGGLSGRANLQVLARLGGHADRVDAALATVGLADRADDLVSAYSQGMRQRLGIAAALLPDPDLVILDEPANGLDPAGIRELRGTLRTLAADGTTVFVSSHQLTELEQVCDHVVLLREGRLAYQGPLEELLREHVGELIARPDHHSQLGDLARLAQQRGWATRVENGSVVVSAPGEAAAALNRLAHDHGITLTHLQRRAASLEEIFFALTDQPGAKDA